MEKLYFGQWLQQVREEYYKESLHQFAKRCGIKRSTLINIESGRTLCPSVETMKKIQDGLKIRIDRMNFKIPEELKERQGRRKRYCMVLNHKITDIHRRLDEINLMKDATLYLYDPYVLEKQLESVSQKLNQMLSEIDFDPKATKSKDDEFMDELEEFYKKL